jgi:hypothetical protein
MAVLVQALTDLETGWDYKQGYVIGTTTYIDGSPALRAKELPELEEWFLVDDPKFWYVAEIKVKLSNDLLGQRGPALHERRLFAVEYQPDCAPFSFSGCCEALGIRTVIARRAVARWLELRRGGKRTQFGIFRHRRIVETESDLC